MDVDVFKYLSKEDIKTFLKKSNSKAAFEVASAWFWVAFACGKKNGVKLQ